MDVGKMSEFEYYADYELQWSPDVAQASALEVGATSEVVSQAVVSLALRGAAAAGSSVSRVQVSSLPSAKFGSARRVESSLSVLQMKGMPSLTTQDLSRAGLGAFVPSDPQTGRARHAALVSHLTSRLLGAGWTALGGSDAGSVSEGDTVVLVHALALGDLRPVVSIRLQQCPHGMHVRLHGGAVAVTPWSLPSSGGEDLVWARASPQAPLLAYALPSLALVRVHGTAPAPPADAHAAALAAAGYVVGGPWVRVRPSVGSLGRFLPRLLQGEGGGEGVEPGGFDRCPEVCLPSSLLLSDIVAVPWEGRRAAPGAMRAALAALLGVAGPTPRMDEGPSPSLGPSALGTWLEGEVRGMNAGARVLLLSAGGNWSSVPLYARGAVPCGGGGSGAPPPVPALPTSQAVHASHQHTGGVLMSGKAAARVQQPAPAVSPVRPAPTAAQYESSDLSDSEEEGPPPVVLPVRIKIGVGGGWRRDAPPTGTVAPSGGQGGSRKLSFRPVVDVALPAPPTTLVKAPPGKAVPPPPPLVHTPLLTWVLGRGADKAPSVASEWTATTDLLRALRYGSCPVAALMPCSALSPSSSLSLGPPLRVGTVRYGSALSSLFPPLTPSKGGGDGTADGSPPQHEGGILHPVRCPTDADEAAEVAALASASARPLYSGGLASADMSIYATLGRGGSALFALGGAGVQVQADAIPSGLWEGEGEGAGEGGEKRGRGEEEGGAPPPGRPPAKKAKAAPTAAEAATAAAELEGLAERVRGLLRGAGAGAGGAEAALTAPGAVELKHLKAYLKLSGRPVSGTKAKAVARVLVHIRTAGSQ